MAQGVAEPAPDAPPLSTYRLTPRQTDVLGLLLRGQSNKLIARELNLSVETVKDHVAAVLRALGVHSRTQAVLAVSRMPHDRVPAAHEAPASGSGPAWRPPAPR
jgi:DNA-binding NarL/FixJ family response regulator